jgi:Ca-activated chloride channel family protein
MSGGGALAALDRLGASLGIDALQHGEWLPLLALLSVLALWLALRQRPSALAWPLGRGAARRIDARRFEPQRLVGGVLRCLCLLCLAVVICGPIAQRVHAPEPGLGLDLILVLDTSESMGERDTLQSADPASAGTSRLELARRAVARFASQRVSEGDRVGLVVFGDHAFTASPLTSDGGLLRHALEHVAVGMAGKETALGDALALAVKRASAVEESPQRVIVLLTDGRSNAGSVPVAIASELARAAGVRVHTVGIGVDANATSPEAIAEPADALFEKHAPDPRTLREISDHSGGRFFAARTALDLQAVYAEIDGIERRRRPLPPRIAERAVPEPMLAAAFSLLLVEIGISRLWHRRLP